MASCLLVATLSQADGRTDAVPKAHMQNAFAAKFTSASQGVSSRLLRLLNAVASGEKDIYQFGVFTGTGLKKIADGVRSKELRIWGFDSFQGIPPETSEEVESWKSPAGKKKAHFLEGGYSAAAALGDASVSSVVRKVAARVGHKDRVSLVPGYFNESLSDELLRDRGLRPALLVDMDADIYLSAMQALDWMFAKRLIVPGTFVRYDDWPRFNATHGPYKGTNFFGQARAHYELSEKWDVRWKLVATGAVQVVSIGADVCAASLCGKAPALREVLHMSASHPSNRDDPRLLPLSNPNPNPNPQPNPRPDPSPNP